MKYQETRIEVGTVVQDKHCERKNHRLHVETRGLRISAPRTCQAPHQPLVTATRALIWVSPPHSTRRHTLRRIMDGNPTISTKLASDPLPTLGTKLGEMESLKGNSPQRLPLFSHSSSSKYPLVSFSLSRKRIMVMIASALVLRLLWLSPSLASTAPQTRSSPFQMPQYDLPTYISHSVSVTIGLYPPR